MMSPSFVYIIFTSLISQCICSTFNCNTSSNECKRSKIHCKEGEDCVINCSEMESCDDSEIHCPVNGNCTVNCLAESSCKDSKISGPFNGNMVINCNGERSCFDATFHGEDAQQMSINGCVEYASCFGIALYCPPNTNGTANCLIEGDNHLLIRLYAFNGWRDVVSIDESAQFGVYHEGTMHCGYNYERQCDISSDSWSCDGDICDGNNNNINGNVIQIENTPSENIVVLLNDTNDQILPDLTADFEHGSMGMVLIGGGLIALAIVCIVCGIFRASIMKLKMRMNEKANKEKGYEQNPRSDMMDDEEDEVYRQQKRKLRKVKKHKQVGVNV